MQSKKTSIEDEEQNNECLEYFVITEHTPHINSDFLFDHQKAILWYLNYFENFQNWNKESFNLIGSLNIHSNKQSLAFKNSEKYKIDCLKKSRICIIGTQTSSGKTRVLWEYIRSVPIGPRREFITVGSFFHEIKFLKYSNWTIIVVPFTLKFQWLEEAEKINFSKEMIIVDFDFQTLESLDLNLPYVILTSSNRDKLKTLIDFNCCFSRVIYDEIDKENVLFLVSSFTIFVTATIMSFVNEELKYLPAIRNTINGVIKSATYVSKLPCLLCDQNYLDSIMPIIKMSNAKTKQFKNLNILNFNQKTNIKFKYQLLDAKCQNFLNSIRIDKCENFLNTNFKNIIKINNESDLSFNKLIAYIKDKKHNKFVIVYAFKELKSYYDSQKKKQLKFIHNYLGLDTYCIFNSNSRALNNSIENWKKNGGVIVLNLLDHIEGFNLSDSQAIFFISCDGVNKSLLIQCLGRCQRFGRTVPLEVYNINFDEAELNENEWDLINYFEKSKQMWKDWVEEKQNRKKQKKLNTNI